jgi:hypothetical protein
MATQFTTKCHCGDGELTFRSEAGYTEQVVERLYCPVCADRAAATDTMIRVSTNPDKLGIWGVGLNEASLKLMDPDTPPSTILGTNKLIIVDEPDAEVLGQKGNQRDISDSPTKLPKKTVRRPDESPRPLHGG